MGKPTTLAVQHAHQPDLPNRGESKNHGGEQASVRFIGGVRQAGLWADRWAAPQPFRTLEVMIQNWLSARARLGKDVGSFGRRLRRQLVVQRRWQESGWLGSTIVAWIGPRWVALARRRGMGEFGGT